MHNRSLARKQNELHHNATLPTLSILPSQRTCDRSTKRHSEHYDVRLGHQLHHCPIQSSTYLFSCEQQAATTPTGRARIRTRLLVVRGWRRGEASVAHRDEQCVQIPESARQEAATYKSMHTISHIPYLSACRRPWRSCAHGGSGDVLADGRNRREQAW